MSSSSFPLSEFFKNLSLRNGEPNGDKTQNSGIPTQRERMLNGELFYSFTPELVEARRRCGVACNEFNSRGPSSSRFERVRLMNRIFGLPEPTEEKIKDNTLLLNYPWIEPPFRADYGTNIHISPSTFINFSCTILDTCTVTIGPRVLIGPNVSFYTATHPIDPRIRNGLDGPELGKPIVVEEDVWIGGGVIILPGIRIKRGSVVGAGSIVTKDVDEYVVVAGNPARLIRRITEMDEEMVQPPRTPTEEEIEAERRRLQSLSL